MATRNKKIAEPNSEPLEKQLWKAADKLRKNIDAAEYKHVVLGLIFLRYISDSFATVYEVLQKGEGEIRRALIEKGNLIDCIVNLPAKLFLNTQIPAALWFMNRARANGEHPRKGEILFIDARNMGQLINRRTRTLSAEDIQHISNTYHAWGKNDDSNDDNYSDIAGFCANVPISRVAELDYVLTPGRYVGLPDEEDDFNFAERFATLKAEFAAQLQEEATLNQAILDNLAKVKV